MKHCPICESPIGENDTVCPTCRHSLSTNNINSLDANLFFNGAKPSSTATATSEELSQMIKIDCAFVALIAVLGWLLSL